MLAGRGGPRVGTASTVGNRCRCIFSNDAGQLLDALIDSLLVVYQGLSRESVLKARLESTPVCLFRTGWLGLHHRHFRTSPLRQTAARSVFCVGWSGGSVSRDEAAASDNLIPASAMFLLFGKRLSWSSFGRWQARGDAILSAALPLHSLCSSHLCLFPLTATTIVGSVVFSAAAALKLLL
jgi:hypothetical protein